MIYLSDKHMSMTIFFSMLWKVELWTCVPLPGSVIFLRSSEMAWPYLCRVCVPKLQVCEQADHGPQG